LQDAIKEQRIKLNDSKNLFRKIEIQYLTINLNVLKENKRLMRRLMQPAEADYEHDNDGK
jgi:hypothetical protein